jgi:hypothetical protein
LGVIGDDLDARGLAVAHPIPASLLQRADQVIE